jgi:hypothetical protein
MDTSVSDKCLALMGVDTLYEHNQDYFEKSFVVFVMFDASDNCLQMLIRFLVFFC